MVALESTHRSSHSILTSLQAIRSLSPFLSRVYWFQLEVDKFKTTKIKTQKIRFDHGDIDDTVVTTSEEPVLFVENKKKERNIEHDLRDIRQLFYTHNIQGLISMAQHQAKPRKGKVSFKLEYTHTLGK